MTRPNTSIPRKDEPKRQTGSKRAEGAEEEIANTTPPDQREATGAYLRNLERTHHFRPIIETAGTDQG